MWAPLTSLVFVAGFPLRVAMVCDIFFWNKSGIFFLGFLGGLLQESQQPKLCVFFFSGGGGDEAFCRVRYI